MLTVIIRRDAEPNVTQLTQQSILKELWGIDGSELLLEDTWSAGLKKVRTPYVCLVESDCTLSGSYLSSNLGLMRKDNHNGDKGTGGYLKRAMLASCVGYESFANRIYSYELDKLRDIYTKEVVGKNWHIAPNRKKLSAKPYHVQVAFVPGAVIRYSAIKDIIDDFNWDERNLVKLSTDLSFYLWNTNRRIQSNPNTTYVSNDSNVESPPLFDIKVPDKVANIFHQEGIGWLV